MARTRDVVKGTDEAMDDDTFFVRQYQQTMNKGKERTQAKRSKIHRDHATRVDALRRTIRSVPLQQPSTIKSSSGQDTAARREPGLETLRRLMERMNDIEKRIASTVRGLETAFNTTSKEIRVGLDARAEAGLGTAK